MKKMIRFIGWSVLYVVVLFLTGELYLRAIGYELNYTQFASDIVLGWKSRDMDTVSSEDPSVTEHVWRNGMRRNRERFDKECRKRVAVFGCSFTYGAGVSDEETYCWKLNSLYPDVAFDNYGVGGYGPYQCYLSMCDILSRQKNGTAPEYDLVLYSMWHGQLRRNVVVSYAERNDVDNPKLREDGFYELAPWVELHNGQLVAYAPKPWPEYVKNSYLLTYIARARMGFQRSQMDKKEENNEYYRCAFVKVAEKMGELGQEYNIPIVLCLLDNDEKEIFKEGIPSGLIVAEIPLKELTQINNVKYRVRHQPGFHPNGEAHTYWAEHISAFLKEHNLP